MPTTTPQDSTFRGLIRTLGLLRRVMEPHFARFALSGAQWGVLRVLHRAEEAGEQRLRLTDIGERLLIRPPSVTGVVDRLQKQALLKTTPAADDHRAKVVSLTAAGRQKIRRVLDEMPKQVESVLGCLTADERQQLRSEERRVGK